MSFVSERPREIIAIAIKLLDWYEANSRDLPWRRTTDPYSIYVSEIMLQQTQVTTVLPYWERWMKALPTLDDLARARPDKLNKLWEGLGYYRRVRNMHQAARQIASKHNGCFPDQYEAVLELPGVGRYTAGAICSIAFNQPRPILDGNVIRVLTRIFGIGGDPAGQATKDRLWSIAERLVQTAKDIEERRVSTQTATLDANVEPGAPRRLCADLNQALMELGSLICTPRTPACDNCPLRESCRARLTGRTHLLPALRRRRATTRRHFVAFVMKRGNRYLVRQRPPDVVNGMLWEFPNLELTSRKLSPGAAATRAFGVKRAGLEELCRIQHSITRFRIQVEAYKVLLPSDTTPEVQDGRWVTANGLRNLAFSSAHRKIVNALGI